MTASAGGRHADVCLVNMPYAGLSRPSIALGLLQGILERDGISSIVAPACLWFAEIVGITLYHLPDIGIPVTFLAGEWTFAGAAFPDARETDEQYLEQLRDAYPELGRRPGGDEDRMIADLRQLRSAASAFIDLAAHRILDSRPLVVGCTSTFQQHVSSLALLRRIRELDPDVITMLGGANCETTMGEATHRNFPWVDYVVSGEADGVIAPLCRLAIKHGRDVSPEDLPKGVLGPRHRTSGGDQVRKLPRALFRDLDELPTPRYDDQFDAIAASPLRDDITPGLPLETSRGCWWGARHQCTFCGLNGSSMAFHSKSPDRVLSEIRELETRYGISSFEVVDNILDMTYFETLLPQLAQERPRRLFYEVKANLSRRHVETLVRAGVVWVQPGIESLHTEVLRLMDKGIRGWQNVQLLKWSRELGLRLSWSVLWDFPGERDEWYTAMAGWVPQLEHLQPPAGLASLRYDRYSVYFNEAERRGLCLEPVPAMSYVYPVSAADLARLTYFFTAAPVKEASLGTGADPAARPGVRALHAAVQDWRRNFDRSPGPVLSMRDTGEHLHIIDTRSQAVALRHTLTGLPRAICLAADSAPSEKKLAAVIRDEYDASVSEREVSEASRQLIADGLILPMDGRLVGLAIKDGMPHLLPNSAFPGGRVTLDDQ